MLDTPYEYIKVSKETSTNEPINKIHYRFTAKHRRYFVTFEFFSFNIVAVKYRDRLDKKSSTGYQMIFNDGDAFRVIGTCINIMAAVWKENPSISFAFYAVPRNNINPHSRRTKSLESQEEYVRSRFNIYRYGMENYFAPERFSHIRDIENCIYILLNNDYKSSSESLNKLSKYLLQNHEIIFSPER